MNLLKRTLLGVGLFGVLTNGLMAADAFKMPPEDLRMLGEKIEFDGGNANTFPDLIKGQFNEKIKLQGYWSAPKNAGNAKLPVMVMFPGADGVHLYSAPYIKKLNASGIATLMVDPIGSRGFQMISDDFSKVILPWMVGDAASALKMLSNRTDVDVERIGIMGWSAGGAVVLMSGYPELLAGIAGKNANYKAHVAFYPPCIFRMASTNSTTDPWLLLTGASDDLTPPQLCTPFVEEIDKTAKVEWISYPHTYHSFDSYYPFAFYPKSFNVGKCMFDVNKQWQIVDSASHAVLNTPADHKKAYAKCARMGAHLGVETAARDDALVQVDTFAKATLLKP